MPTMLLSSRLYPSRTGVPNTESASIPVRAGGMVTLDAPPQIVALNASPTPDTYSFLFWHANRVLDAQHVVTFNAPADESNFFATAWYRKNVIGGPPGTPHISTVAFSLDKDDLIADTPIAAATPAGAWTGPPSTAVSTTLGAATVTAKALIDGAGEFTFWLPIGGSASGAVLSVAAQASSLAIASYGIPRPDPCATLRMQRDSIEPGDFTTPEAYRRALLAANQRLHSCEKAHGEPID